MAPAPALPFLDSLHGLLDQWSTATLAGAIVWTRALGGDAVATLRARRLADLVRHARLHSPYFRDAWRALPDDPPLASLPVTHKASLMAAFDAWCTDRAITRREVDAFVATRAHIGERFRDRYVVWTSSGTTGTPGIFVQDAMALATYDALVSVPVTSGTARGCDWTAAAAQGGRAALVTADGGHFASIASWRRLAQGRPWLAMRSFPVTLPLRELVAALAAYAPSFLASYPTVLAMLAGEQAAGRLALRPVGLWSGGEVLSRAAQRAIERAFGCPLHNEYGASECLAIGFGCSEGAVHVNADWVILEPVDRDYRPVSAGTLSHTVLVTNLANAVQPIVRYDLGDRVRMLAGPCACGCPLPALHVEGRCDDVLVLHAADGRAVALPPLALATIVEETAHVHRFQIVQAAADALVLRLTAGERAAGDIALRALREYLARQGLARVQVRLAAEEPVASARDGKLRQVVALRGGAPSRE
ncbi:MAG: AMP-binding protein [Burkholderiales bacterium]